MKQKAVVDRFEGNKAVLFIEDDEHVVLKSELPKKVKEGDWLQIEFEKGKLVSAEIDEAENARTRERIAEKLVRLRKRNK